MSKLTNLNEDIKLIKRKKPKLQRFKVFAFLGLCLGLVMIAADLISGLLTLGSFSLSGMFNQANVVINAHTLYSVNMDKFGTHTEAENMAGFVSMQGAAAFIWQQDKEYLIIGNIYATKSEAESVKANLLVTNPDVFVSEINFKKINLNVEKYSKEQRVIVKNSYQYITEIGNLLYDYLIKLDKKEITPTTASSYINAVKSECKIIGTNLDVINSTVIYESTINLKNAYVKITDVLDELMLKLISNSQINHIMKFSYANIIRIKYDLFNNL